MKTYISRILLIFVLIFVSIFSIGQKKKEGVKRLHLLPVYLIYNNGIAGDSSFDNVVREAFTRHKVKLIGFKEFNQLNEGEALRIESKFRARQDAFDSKSDVREAIAKEQKFVTNMLEITFIQNVSGDSVSIISINWENTPYPPGVSSSRSSGEKVSVLKDTCCSIKDQVFALVDDILFSKWVK